MLEILFCKTKHCSFKASEEKLSFFFYENYIKFLDFKFSQHLRTERAGQQTEWYNPPKSDNPVFLLQLLIYKLYFILDY